MDRLGKRLRCGLALGLAAAVMLSTAALAAEPGKSRTEQRREDLEFLYQTVLVEHHPDVFANTPEAEFLALKQEIASRLETESDAAFLLDLQRLTALVGDSHTAIAVGRSAEAFRAYPFSMVWRDGRWYLSAAAPENRALLGQEVTHLAGRPVEEAAAAFGTLLSADNPVYLRRQFRQSCSMADFYEYLGLTEAGKPLTVLLKSGKTLSLEPMDLEAVNRMELARISELMKGVPETAEADAYYFAKPLNSSVYYIQYNICQEAEDLSMEDFAAYVWGELDAGSYDRILLDLRNNGGGSDGVIWPLLEVLRKRMDLGEELVGLIGERTFSSALINAVEIQELGGVLAGESAGGSVCHFGAVQGFSLPNSRVRGQISSKYIDLNTLLDAGAGRGVAALEPDVSVPQTLADTLAGKDAVVEWLLAHPEELQPKAYPDAPLTRGRFLGQIYEALGAPEASGDVPPFTDILGIEWFLRPLCWAAEAGVARGGADGAFSAARAATWQEAAVFLVRAAEAQGWEPKEGQRSEPLPAALSGSGWTQELVRQAWDWGLLPAETDFSKTPTRAQGEAMAAQLAQSAG